MRLPIAAKNCRSPVALLVIICTYLSAEKPIVLFVVLRGSSALTQVKISSAKIKDSG